MIKPSFHVEVVEPEGVYLLSERGHVALKGELYCRLLPLLDGRRTADAVVDALAGNTPPAQVYYALGLLERQGILVEAVEAASLERAAFWYGLGLDAPQVEARLREATVGLAAFGAVDTEPLAAALVALGLRVRDAAEPGSSPWPALQGGKPGASPADLVVALTDDYLREGLSEINKRALAGGWPWLLVKPVGTVLWVGPLFRPGETACWECLAHR
ncbi:MAG: TOMM precursor leader peptide-binding protein, partial [Chloroflexi bacterium]|nr:TOMM precursor leader peptide-binding protein [Chloroflexota bacterium]